MKYTRNQEIKMTAAKVRELQAQLVAAERKGDQEQADEARVQLAVIRQAGVMFE